MRLGCILSKKHFDQLFGTLSEAIGGADDPVLRWYVEEGMQKLRKADRTSYMSTKLTGSHDSPDDSDSSDEYCKWLDTMDDCDREEFKRAAASFIKDELGADKFEFAGQGGEKVCLVTKQGHALKFGRWKNLLQDEILTNVRNRTLTCFPCVYGYAPDYTSYMCECARESTQKDFADVFGGNIDSYFIYDACCNFNAHRNILEKALRNHKAQLQVLRDLSAFLKSNQLCDIDGTNNWGVTVRDGKKTLVVIDYDL